MPGVRLPAAPGIARTTSPISQPLCPSAGAAVASGLEHGWEVQAEHRDAGDGPAVLSLSWLELTDALTGRGMPFPGMGISGAYQNIHLSTMCKSVPTESTICNNLRIMEVYFEDDSYDRLYVDRGYSAGFSPQIVSLYRRRVQILRAARDENDLAAMQCLNVVRTGANPGHRLSIRLDDQHRLLVELRSKSDQTAVWVLGIERAQPATRGTPK